jgi:2-methylcitrate dehydratase PrpD
VSATDAIVAFATGGWAMRAPVRAAGRSLLAATLARGLRGARCEAAIAVLGITEREPGRGQARAIGRIGRLGAIDAALLNGVAAGGEASLATPVVCAALAAGDAAGAAGAVVLDAIVAGTEIAVRVAASLGSGHVERGWDVDGTCGRLGAAVAAARVFALNAERTRNAIGVAATEAGGLRVAGGTPTAAYVRGLAAADGIEAALLARYGFTGAPQGIEGRRGLAALMAPSFDANAIVDGLGERFAFVELADVGAGDEVTLPAVLLEPLARLERLASLEELPLAV